MTMLKTIELYALNGWYVNYSCINSCIKKAIAQNNIIEGQGVGGEMKSDGKGPRKTSGVGINT